MCQRTGNAILILKSRRMHKIFKHVSGLCLLLFCCYMIFGRWSENKATNIKYKQTSRKHKETNQKYEISSLDDTLRPHTVGQSHLQRSTYDDKKNNQPQRKSCEFWSSSKKLLTSSPQPKPRFKTNPRKFILPWLYNGPNNQLMGLRQAVFVAIYLNRTLVIPVFQKHFNDKTGGMQYIDSNHRFDVPSLQSLVPIITIDEFKRHCGKRIDVVFFGASTNKQQWTLESLTEAERLYKLEILDEKYRAPNSKVLGKGIVKSKSFPTKERGFLFKAEKKAVVEQYNSSQPCAFYAFPFRELRFIVPQVAAKYQTIESNYLNGEEIKETPGAHLYYKIMQHTQCPRYVQDIADDYIKTRFGEREFVALHWRYDKDDFYKFMCTNWGNKQIVTGNVDPRMRNFCSTVFNITPSALPSGVRGYLTKTFPGKFQSTVPVYVAAPPSVIKGISGAFMKHQQEYQLKYYDGRDLYNFLNKEYLLKKCGFLRTNLNDLMSLLETEISIQSSIFFGSQLSSWTDNVKASRKLKRRKSSITRTGKNVDVIATKFSSKKYTLT